MTRLQEDFGTDPKVQYTREMRQAFSLHANLKSWLADYNNIKARWDSSLSKLVESYFTEETATFDLQLVNRITEVAPDFLINPMVEYINSLALAIAYEQVRFKLIGDLIDATPNS